MVYIFEWSTTQLRSLQHDPLITGCIFKGLLYCFNATMVLQEGDQIWHRLAGGTNGKKQTYRDTAGSCWCTWTNLERQLAAAIRSFCKNRALDRRASFVSRKQPFDAFRDYKDYRSDRPRCCKKCLGGYSCGDGEAICLV